MNPLGVLDVLALAVAAWFIAAALVVLFLIQLDRRSQREQNRSFSAERRAAHQDAYHARHR